MPKLTFLKSLHDFFNTNPIFNLVSLVLAILGIILAFYFYFKSIKLRVPTYMVRTINLVRENVQKIDTVKILYANEHVENLSISKIAFWNDGKETIRNLDVARNNPIRIYIAQDYDILDAEVLFHKNPANDFHLKISDDYKHIILSFEYFDFEEGVVLQIFHTGNSSEDVFMSGTIKGSKGIRRKELLNSILPTFVSKILNGGGIKKIKRSKKNKIVGWSIILIGIFFSLSFLFIPDRIDKPSATEKQWIKGLMALLGIPYTYIGFQIIKKHIPKGFNIFLEEF